MDNFIRLTRHPLGYNGVLQRMEVQPHSKDIHEQPGVYLQKVEGCGYDVFELTADEAIVLGNLLIQAGQKTQKEFSNAVTR